MRQLSPASLEQAEIDIRLRTELDAMDGAQAWNASRASHGGLGVGAPPAPGDRMDGSGCWAAGSCARHGSRAAGSADCRHRLDTGDGP